jgi:hypothetical protein
MAALPKDGRAPIAMPEWPYSPLQRPTDSLNRQLAGAVAARTKSPCAILWPAVGIFAQLRASALRSLVQHELKNPNLAI